MTVKMLEMTNGRIPDSGPKAIGHNILDFGVLSGIPNYSLIIIFLRYRAYWMQKMIHMKVRAQRSEVNSF